jgi:hypothetical protein
VNLNIRESAAVANLADSLYEFLPASSAWGTYTLGDAAMELGLGAFWQVGSKRPALQRLLGATYAQRRGRLCDLVELVVKRGIMRRSGKDPVHREEIEAVNNALLLLEFKVPELWASDFLSNLPTLRPAVLEQVTQDPIAGDELERARIESLSLLKDEFLVLSALEDRPDAGRRLERLLNRLFDLHGLSPHEPFRITGEQIDGSFDLDSDTYLLEAKWERGPVGLGDLASLRVKVEGKSAWTRGLFISINGFTDVGVQALVAGKQQNCVLVDGADLFRVLNGDIALDRLLRYKVRWLAERSEPFMPISNLQFDPVD